MELTGKCKEDFEKYLYQKNILNFYKVRPSMKFGVLVDFFDSVGIYIKISCYKKASFTISYKDGKLTNYYSGFIPTRPEARTASIEKADKIYNQKKETKFNQHGVDRIIDS